MAVGRPPLTAWCPPDTAWVLCGLAALGYDGIANAIRQALQQTGLAPHELAMRLGLPRDAVGLWARGSFIPAPTTCCAWGHCSPTTSPHRPAHPRPST